MTVRIIVPLGREEKSALMKLAEIEKRDERQQAAYLIKEALIRLGLLQTIPTKQESINGIPNSSR